MYKKLIGSIAKLYYERGLPIGIVKEIAESKDYEINWYKTAEDLYFNGFSIQTIKNMYKAEDIVLEQFDEFLQQIQQPFRRKGGYELSRAIMYDDCKLSMFQVGDLLTNIK